MFKVGDRVQILSESSSDENIWRIIDIPDNQEDQGNQIYISKATDVRLVRAENLQLYAAPLLTLATQLQPKDVSQKDWAVLWAQMDLHMKTDMRFLTTQQLNEYKQYPTALYYHYGNYLGVSLNFLRGVVNVSSFIENRYTHIYIERVLTNVRHKIYSPNELKLIYWLGIKFFHAANNFEVLGNVLRQCLGKGMFKEYLILKDVYRIDALRSITALFLDPNAVIPPEFLNYVLQIKDRFINVPLRYWNLNFARTIGETSFLLYQTDPQIITKELDYMSYNELIRSGRIEPSTETFWIVRDLTKKIPQPRTLTYMEILPFSVLLYLYSEYDDVDSMNFVIQNTIVNTSHRYFKDMDDSYAQLLQYQTSEDARRANDPTNLQADSFYMKMINSKWGILIWRSVKQYIPPEDYNHVMKYLILNVIDLNYADWMQEIYMLVKDNAFKKVYFQKLFETPYAWKSFRDRNVVPWKDLFWTNYFAPNMKNRLEFLNYMSETQALDLDEKTVWSFFFVIENIYLFEWIFQKWNNPTVAYKCYMNLIKNLEIRTDIIQYKGTNLNPSIVCIFTNISKFIISLDMNNSSGTNDENLLFLRYILHQNIKELETNKIAVQKFFNETMLGNEFNNLVSNVALLGLTDSVAWLMINTNCIRERLEVGYYSKSTSMIDLLRENNIEKNSSPILYFNNDIEVIFYMDPDINRHQKAQRIIQFDNLSCYKYYNVKSIEIVSSYLDINQDSRSITRDINITLNGTNIIKYLYLNDSRKHNNIIRFLLQALTDNCSFAFELFQFMLENVAR